MSSITEKCFVFWSKSTGKYTTLSSMLVRNGWQIFSMSNTSLLAQFGGEPGRLVCLAIMNPIDAMTPEDLQCVETFLRCGHKAIIAHSASDMEAFRPNNINKLTKLFGVAFNEDCVIRPNPFKLYHPGEAMLDDFIANRGLRDSLEKYFDKKRVSDESALDLVEDAEASTLTGMRILYPEGCTLEISDKKSTVMMTSSKWALPSSQPICSFHRNDQTRLIMFGSFKLFTDDYIQKEDNKSLVLSFLEFISNDDFQINISDARTLETPESNMTADADLLADTPISAFQQLEQLPENPLDLMDKRLFSVDNSKLPEVLRAYKELNVEDRPLVLMRPPISWRADGSLVKKQDLKLMLKRNNGRIELI